MKRTAAAFTLLLLLGLTPVARGAYDPLAAGTKTTITLDRSFARFLDRHQIALVAERGAERRGRRLILPVSGGRIDPTSGRGKVQQEGELVFEHGRRRLPFRQLELKATRAPLVAKVGGSQFKVARAKKLRDRREGFGTVLSAIGLTVTEKVATRLNKKLRLPGAFREGQILGAVHARTQPLAATILDSGRATFVPDPAFLAKLDSHFVSLNPVAPAERAPGPTFSFPIIAGGALAPDASLGTLRTGGSLEFLQLGSGQIFWQEPWFDLGAHNVLAEADIEPAPTYPGKLGQVPILELSAGSVASDPGARTIGVSAAWLTLSTASAAHFNQAFAGGKGEFHAGEPLGSISFTAEAQ
jgi:hypothetical protein